MNALYTKKEVFISFLIGINLRGRGFSSVICLLKIELMIFFSFNGFYLFLNEAFFKLTMEFCKRNSNKHLYSFNINI